LEDKIIKHIQNRLSGIEEEHKIEIIYAVESGSRAWGFESTDSDYDVRFIYRHSVDWYLSIVPGRDVIEYPIIDDFDYSGWDIKKTLFLLNKSNPVLFEWMRSPVIYKKYKPAYDLLNSASKEFFSTISSIYHYLYMAKGNYREYLKKDQVRTKKYFYVLRPILACMWIKEFNEPPPMEFEKLLSLISSEQSLLKEILALLDRKRRGVELGVEKRINIINEFIEHKFDYFETVVTEYQEQEKPDRKKLDFVFRSILRS